MTNASGGDIEDLNSAPEKAIVEDFNSAPEKIVEDLNSAPEKAIVVPGKISLVKKLAAALTLVVVLVFGVSIALAVKSGEFFFLGCVCACGLI